MNVNEHRSTLALMSAFAEPHTFSHAHVRTLSGQTKVTLAFTQHTRAHLPALSSATLHSLSTVRRQTHTHTHTHTLTG